MDTCGIGSDFRFLYFADIFIRQVRIHLQSLSGLLHLDRRRPQGEIPAYDRPKIVQSMVMFLLALLMRP